MLTCAVLTMDKLPESLINDCSKDILYVLNYLKPEVKYLKEKLIAGEVDGTQYTGECACLVGSLAKAKKTDTNTSDVENLCKIIPFYTMGTHNPGEQWFLNIKEGDTPETNEFSKHAVMLCDLVLADMVSNSDATE